MSRPSTENRPRAKSNASAKSFARGHSRGYSRQSAPASDDEDDITPNRNRSQSNASSTKKRTSMLPSFGSFGKKSGLSASASKPRKSNSRMALHSEEEEEEEDNLYSGRNRNRSGSTLSASVSRMSVGTPEPPNFRRTNTAPTLSRRYVKAKHDYPGGAHDELSLRVGQVVEIKSVVNDDWYIGESEGSSGLFPSSYCEEYTPSPIAIAPPMPKRSIPPSASVVRNLAPPTAYRSPSPANPYASHSESEFDSHGFDDGDHYATAAFASAPQPNPGSRDNTPSPAFHISGPGSGSIKKKAPPPPPSRRSQSSSNILAASLPSNSFLSPPQARQRSNTASAEASPFGGSDDEEYLEAHGHGHGTVPAPGNGIGNGNGLGAMHLGREVVEMEDCGICGCDDFTQNSFKAKGTCSTCFHSH
jgi:endophilin-A